MRAPQFGYGRCPVCDRPKILRADGRIPVHYIDRMTQCGGSRRNPANEGPR